MPAFFIGVNMSEKSVRPPVSPQSSRQEIADYINHAFETSEIGEICQAIGAVTHLHDISDIAKKSSIGRVSVYRAFAGERHPNFKTVLSVLDAMGFRLQVKVRRGGRARPTRSARISELWET
jgi:probable addiction module antidote protein